MSILGIDVAPSAGNFVLARLGFRAKEIHDALLQRGFIVRSIETYGEPDSLRISIGTAEQNEAFVACLRSLLCLSLPIRETASVNTLVLNP